MTKVDIKRLDSITKNDTTATEQINDNFKALQEAIENTLSRDGTGPNFMDADLDMNSYRIINSADPTEDNDIVNLKYVEERIGGAVEASKTASNAATQAANSAQSALVSSTNAINTLRNAEEQLNNVIQYVDEAKQTIDETIDAAIEDVKQQALDAAQESIDTAAAQATEIVINYANNDIKPQLNEIVANAEADAENAAESAEIASNESEEAKHWADDARVWATGEDAEVEEIAPGEEEHSSRGYADLAMALSNTPEDTPVDMSKLLALDVIKGPKGEKGDKGDKGDDGKDGGGLEIGDVAFAVMGIDETKNLRRYLNGQVISQSQFVSFANWVKERAKLYPNTVATEENWQAEVTNSKLGQCGKFVIDDTLGTIRLPKVVNIQGLQDLALMGSVKAESLPNITGSFRSDGSNNEGAFYKSGDISGEGISWGTGGSDVRIGFDASRSSSTYQDNAPVQQEAIRYPYFIQVATGVEESVDVTREIELNNPFFLGMSQYFESEPKNASWLESNGSFHSGAVYKSFYEWLLKIYNGAEIVDGVSVKASTDTYGNYDYVINITEATFRLPLLDGKENLPNYSAKISLKENAFPYTAPADGVLHINEQTNNGIPVVYVNGVSVWSQNDDNNYKTCEIYISKGDVVTIKNIVYIGDTSGFFPLKGNGSLYFYVGETVQDANVINASGVLTRVAELSDEYIVGLGMPDYSAGVDITSILKASPYSYTVSCNGVIRFLTQGQSCWLINETSKTDIVNSLLYIDGEDGVHITSYLQVLKGQVIYNTGDKNGIKAVFYPLKGAN